MKNEVFRKYKHRFLNSSDVSGDGPGTRQFFFKGKNVEKKTRQLPGHAPRVKEIPVPDVATLTDFVPTDAVPTDVVPAGAVPNDVEVADAVLTDAALKNGGLDKVTAFVRVERSGAAIRKQRSRDKSAAQGVAQLNLELPLPVHQVFKDIAQELQCTGDVATAMQNVLAALAWDAPTVSGNRGRLDGWRRWLAQFLRLLGRRRTE